MTDEYTAESLQGTELEQKITRLMELLVRQLRWHGVSLTGPQDVEQSRTSIVYGMLINHSEDSDRVDRQKLNRALSSVFVNRIKLDPLHMVPGSDAVVDYKALANDEDFVQNVDAWIWRLEQLIDPRPHTFSLS